jgi:hypothetical protein
VGSRAVLDAVVKRKTPSPRRESNPRIPIIQPVANSTNLYGGKDISVKWGDMKNENQGNREHLK